MTIRRIELYRLRIPFRLTFRHSQARRRSSDNLVVRIILANGRSGYGEGIPREYVTGETMDAALRVARQIYFPVLAQAQADSFAEAVAVARQLPFHSHDGAHFMATRCACELAVLDAFGGHFDNSLAAVKEYVSDLRYQGNSRLIRPSGILPLMNAPLSRLAFAFWTRVRHVHDVKVKWGKLADAKRFRLMHQLQRRAR